jgi:hypothetical protein
LAGVGPSGSYIRRSPPKLPGCSVSLNTLATGYCSEEEEEEEAAMGGGNGQKAKTARERNMEKQKAAKGTHIFPLRIRGEQF